MENYITENLSFLIVVRELLMHNPASSSDPASLLNVPIAKQQRSYLAHVIRQEDNTIAKRLLFDNEMSLAHGRKIALLEKVIEKEACTKTQFIERAMTKIY